MLCSHSTFVSIISLVYYRTISRVKTEMMLTQLIKVAACICVGMFMNAGKTSNLPSLKHYRCFIVLFLLHHKIILYTEYTVSLVQCADNVCVPACVSAWVCKHPRPKWMRTLGLSWSSVHLNPAKVIGGVKKGDLL